jgi:hypothetical protein
MTAKAADRSKQIPLRMGKEPRREVEGRTRVDQIVAPSKRPRKAKY